MNRRRWKRVTVIVTMILVLVFAFWYGGDETGLYGFSVPDSENTGTDVSGKTTDFLEDSLSNEGLRRGQETGDSEEIPSGQMTDSVQSEKISSKKENTSEDGNIFQKIFMKIKQTGHSSNTGKKKTQNNKKAQANANKAAKKSRKKNKKTADKKQKNTSGTVENETQDDRTSEQAGTNPDSGTEAGNSTSQPAEEIMDNKISCTISISCKTILENMDRLKESKKKMVPQDGLVLKTTAVKIKEGSSVFDVLRDVTKTNDIHLEYNFTPLYKSYYIEGIHNLYEQDCGELSGWMYSVNGKFPGISCSSYEVKEGDIINWVYTCNLGKDVGGYFEE